MAGKKDKCVVCVISELTDRQANDMLSGFGRVKNKIAPCSRGTAVQTDREGISRVLQSGVKRISKGR